VQQDWAAACTELASVLTTRGRSREATAVGEHPIC
jgi:hypothetical protein